MVKKLTCTLVIILLFSNIYGQWAPTITDLKNHVYYLASPELEGRQAGTSGDSIAASYIRDQFNATGSILQGINGFQYFSMVTDVVAGGENSFAVNSRNFALNKDFTPFSFSSSATLNQTGAFAGFGISGQSGSLSWNDYESIDVKGKWVLVLRGDPEPDNAASAFIPMATDRAKALLAKDKGAAGILLVSPSSIEKVDVPVDLSFDKSISDAGIPVISITRELASILLNTSQSSIDSIEKAMILGQKPSSFYFEAKLKATTSIIRKEAISRNVIALVEGKDENLKNEYVVIGAHYDHLGMGGEGSGSRVPDKKAIHGGADDNASGVAALIELIKYFSSIENRPSRSILFVSFGAEEMGLIGARYFIDHSPVPVKSIKAMINVDMVGRLKENDPSVTISGTGTFSHADSLLDQFGKSYSFSIKKIIDGYGPSDHSAFYTSGIPVLFISTGAHSDYHTPLDAPERLNYHGLSEITSLTAELTSAIGNLTTAPIFAEAGGNKGSGQYGRSLKVTLGIMPDVSGAGTSGGMKVEGTRKDAPAARSGMLKGDIITAINGLPVTNIYDYMSRLGKLKPGDVVNVEILRNDTREVLIIQL